MALTPTHADKFSFGLWTIGYNGADPFGGPTRAPMEIEHVVEKLAEVGAYGLYVGDTVARDNFRDHIVIYEDTLQRDFGYDHNLLRAQIVRTVRHEVAHHLGWDEQGVRDLGL